MNSLAVGNKGLIIGFCVCGWKITSVLLQSQKKNKTKNQPNVNTGQCCESVKTPGGNVTLCDPAQWSYMGLTLVGEDTSAVVGHRSHSGSHTPNVCQDA